MVLCTDLKQVCLRCYPIITTVVRLGISWLSAKYRFQIAPINKAACVETFFIGIVSNILFLVDLPLIGVSLQFRRLSHTCRRLFLAIPVVDRSSCSPSSCPVLCFQGSKVQTRVGLLMLLCTWISNCPIAVTHFLHNQENVPFVSLTNLVASARTCTDTVHPHHMTWSSNQPWLCHLSSWRRRSQRTWEKMRGWCRACARCCWESASITTTTRWKTTPSRFHSVGRSCAPISEWF